MALVTARLQEIERDASSIVRCGTCMVQRAQRVRTARNYLEVSLVTGALMFGLVTRGLHPGWRYGYLTVWSAGATTLALYFIEMIC